MELETICMYFSHFFKEKTGNEVRRDGNVLEIKNANPLFFFNYTAKLEVNLKDKLSVSYSFSLIELFKVLILLVIFTAFFSKYSVHEYLVVVAVFSFIFVFLNLLLINSNTRKLIKQAIEQAIEGNKTDFTQEQQAWLVNKDKCPACGFDISEYDKLCPDCGLKLRNSVPTKPYDISGDYDRIKYHISGSATGVKSEKLKVKS